MIQIENRDKKAVARVLARAYSDNPTIEALFKQSSTLKQREKLFSILLEELIKLRSVYTTDCGKGVAVLYEGGSRASLFIRLKTRVKLLPFIGPQKLIKANQRQQYAATKRKQIPHLYFWILAVDPSNKGLSPIIEIRDFAFDLSRKHQLPILAETPLIRTRNLYERYGFTVYNELVFPHGPLWLMERSPVL